MNYKKTIKRIYLAGRISDLHYRKVYDEFKDAKLFLLSQGFDEVINPCEIVPPGTGWTEAMIILLPYLSICNYLALLPGYEPSNGAMCEYYFARGMENEGKLKAIIHIEIPKEIKQTITEPLKQAV